MVCGVLAFGRYSIVDISYLLLLSITVLLAWTGLLVSINHHYNETNKFNHLTHLDSLLENTVLRYILLTPLPSARDGEEHSIYAMKHMGGIKRQIPHIVRRCIFPREEKVKALIIRDRVSKKSENTCLRV